MSEHKSFPVVVVLTVTTGRLLCEMEDVYDILNFMTGDNLFTHQLPRASDQCSPWLLKWYPELAEAGIPANLAKLDNMLSGAESRNPEFKNVASEIAVRNWSEWVSVKVPNLKKEYEIERIPHYECKEPIQELRDMIAEKEVLEKEQIKHFKRFCLQYLRY